MGCVCPVAPRRVKPAFCDLSGLRFDRLEVIERVPDPTEKEAMWRCICDCGIVIVTRSTRLRKGYATSCGCARRDRCLAGDVRRSHGLSKRRVYSQLYAAKARAEKSGIPFDIVVTDIHIPERCPVLGIEFDSGGRETSPSLDKIVPENGYVLGNIRIISNRANRLKSDATPEELRRILAYCEGRL